jgi:6-phosphofructokinase 1
VSDVDAREARMVGRVAVRYTHDAEVRQGSVAMRRTSDAPYAVETFLTPLQSVAKETKHLGPEFLRDGNNVTDAFKAYVRPLVGALPVVGSFDELKG